MSQARPPHSDSRAAGHIDDIVDAMLLATRGTDIEQTFAMSDLPRVSDYATDAKAQATLVARFRNMDGKVWIDGEVTAALRMSCQRCMQPVDVPVDDEFSVMLIGSANELDALAPEQDAIVAEAERLDLRWLTEEQLLLASPLVPLHVDEAECGIDVAKQTTVSAPVETQRPFADLRAMLKKP
jgi:uncharacterized protein